ncbi:MAG TPA: hypothetical protein VEU76_03000, partial [Candidatus Udaeobacter sp.]|nr:hypothetical protein [Candidatus Udaeobacter sp.]
AVLNPAFPEALRDLPPDAVIVGSEPLLVEAFSRVRDWLNGSSVQVSAEPVGGWWRVRFSVSGERKQLAVPELGEPLIRLIVDTQLDGWLDASAPDAVDLYLPAYRPR